MKKRLPPGTRERHARSCASRNGPKCDCSPSIEAHVFDKRSGAKIRKSFSGRGALAEAKSWRTAALHAQARGALRTPVRRTLREEALDWLERAERGEITTRSGRPYKPSFLRGVRSDFERHVFDDLGARRVSDVHRRDVQALVDRLRASGLSGSKVRNIVVSLKVVYRRVLENDELAVNPTERLRLPPPAGTRDRVAAPAEVEELLSPLPTDLEVLYATAAFAGLRHGELRALRWDDVDLGDNVIHVRRSWDAKEGPVDPKSAKGLRRAPLVAPLRRRLIEHKMATGRDGEALVFGRSKTDPFTSTHVYDRAAEAWEAENEKRADEERPLLMPIGLHELRHSYVSMMFAAGTSLEEIGDYIGHSTAYMTDRYRHLIDGARAEAGDRFEAYLSRMTGAQTGAQGS